HHVPLEVLHVAVGQVFQAAQEGVDDPQDLVAIIHQPRQAVVDRHHRADPRHEFELSKIQTCAYTTLLRFGSRCTSTLYSSNFSSSALRPRWRAKSRSAVW